MKPTKTTCAAISLAVTLALLSTVVTQTRTGEDGGIATITMPHRLLQSERDHGGINKTHHSHKINAARRLQKKRTMKKKAGAGKTMKAPTKTGGGGGKKMTMVGGATKDVGKKTMAGATKAGGKKMTMDTTKGGGAVTDRTGTNKISSKGFDLFKDKKWCEPWGSDGGDLCYLGKAPAGSTQTCAGAMSNGYIGKSCDKACIEERCFKDKKCVGFTWNKALGQGKPKNKVTSVSENSSSAYDCFNKKVNPLQEEDFEHDCDLDESATADETSPKGTKNGNGKNGKTSGAMGTTKDKAKKGAMMMAGNKKMGGIMGATKTQTMTGTKKTTGRKKAGGKKKVKRKIKKNLRGLHEIYIQNETMSESIVGADPGGEMQRALVGTENNTRHRQWAKFVRRLKKTMKKKAGAATKKTGGGGKMKAGARTKTGGGGKKMTTGGTKAGRGATKAGDKKMNTGTTKGGEGKKNMDTTKAGGKMNTGSSTATDGNKNGSIGFDLFKQKWCEPWGPDGGDLCHLGKAPVGSTQTCAGVMPSGYIGKSCDKACIEERCLKDKKCVGFTWNNAWGQGKPKNKVTSVSEESSFVYDCFAKKGTHVRLPTDKQKVDVKCKRGRKTQEEATDAQTEEPIEEEEATEEPTEEPIEEEEATEEPTEEPIEEEEATEEPTDSETEAPTNEGTGEGTNDSTSEA